MTLADKLRPFVAALKEASAAGDKRAAEVITLYRMHCACPSDPAAPALCEAAFNDWLKQQKETDDAVTA